MGAGQLTAEQRRLMRRALIDIAQRRQRPGAGSARALLEQRTVYHPWPDLTAVLSPIAWAVVGAVATRLYMPERATRHMDIVVAAVDAPEAYRRLQAAGFEQEGRLITGSVSWRSPGGQRIDVIEGREGWWPEAIAAAQSNRDMAGLPILPLPWLVLMKFQAGCAQDVADVARMLGQADDAVLMTVRALFRRHTDEAAQEDLESLIALGRLEMQ